MGDAACPRSPLVKPHEREGRRRGLVPAGAGRQRGRRTHRCRGPHTPQERRQESRAGAAGLEQATVQLAPSEGTVPPRAGCGGQQLRNGRRWSARPAGAGATLGLAPSMTSAANTAQGLHPGSRPRTALPDWPLGRHTGWRLTSIDSGAAPGPPGRREGGQKGHASRDHQQATGVRLTLSQTGVMNSSYLIA